MEGYVDNMYKIVYIIIFIQDRDDTVYTYWLVLKKKIDKFFEDVF